MCYNMNQIIGQIVKNMKRISFFFLIILFTFSRPVSCEEVYTDKYVAPDGIEIISYTESWQGSQLESIYQELLENTHGEELSYLSSVQLHGGQSPNGTEEGLYSYTLQKRNFLVTTSVRLQKDSVIHLYHMDEKDTIGEVARVLSHEYGHHFTIYYLAKNDSAFFLEWEDSDFYQVRQGSIYDEMGDDPDMEHRWMIAEICAEDYVQLYGSPAAKVTEKVYDIAERLDKGYLNSNILYSSQSYNIVPQENMGIPLALEVEEATGYWQNLSGIDPEKDSYTKPELILGQRIQLRGGYVKQELTWTASTNENGEEALYYTLVALDRDTNQFIPIKSVTRAEQKIAVVGAVEESTGRGYSIYTDSFAQQLGENGYDDLRVIAIGSSGEAVSSVSYLMDFNNGTLSVASAVSQDGLIQYSSTVQENSGGDNWAMEVLDGFLDWLFALFEQLFDE